LALDKFTDEENVENLTCDMRSVHDDVQSSEQEVMIPPPDMFMEGWSVGSPDHPVPITKGDNQCQDTTQPLSEITPFPHIEQSLDTDSGRGSPMMQDVGQFKVNMNQTTIVRTDHSPSSSTKPTIQPETLAHIAVSMGQLGITLCSLFIHLIITKTMSSFSGFSYRWTDKYCR
jgi:hypothetical protein